MSLICGKVIPIEPGVISWTLERELSNLSSASPSFSIHGYSNRLFLAVLYTGTEFPSRDLYLGERIIDSNERLSTTYDLNIKLKYRNKTKQFPVKCAIFHRTKTMCYYRLARIETKDLLEITCTFLDSKTEICDEKNEEECKDNNASSSRKLEENGEKQVDTEEKEAIKTKGETAVIKSLTNIFLEEEYSDIILKVGGKKYAAHKVIIASRSDVFRAMLKHDMKEKTEGEIVIEDCDPDVFRDFLFYIYTGNLNNITTDNVFELYHIADKYDVNELRMECVDFIVNNLTTDMICDTISLATRHCNRELLSLATAFFTEHAKDIVTTVSWQKFVKENPIEANELFIKTLNKDHSK